MVKNSDLAIGECKLSFDRTFAKKMNFDQNLSILDLADGTSTEFIFAKCKDHSSKTCNQNQSYCLMILNFVIILGIFHTSHEASSKAESFLDSH